MSKLSFFDAALMDAVAHTAASPEHILVCVAQQESEAQKIESALRALTVGALQSEEILYVPGFVQAGVFRFESARKVIAKRLGALASLAHQVPRIVVTTVNGFSRLIPSLNWLQKNSIQLKIGTALDVDRLLAKFVLLNYVKVQRVEDVGEFAVRGSIVDFWTPGQRHPSRVEFFGDEIEKIRSFRAADQRSFETLAEVALLPAREFVWPGSDVSAEVIDRFNNLLLRQGVSGGVRTDLLENVRHAIPFPGVDDLCPAFADSEFLVLADLVERVAEANQKSVSLLPFATSEDLHAGAQETFHLYDTAATAARTKGQASARLDAVFPGLMERTEKLALRAEWTPRYQLPSHIAQTFAALRGQKFAQRAAALTALRTEKTFQNLVLVSRTQDSFLELAGHLGKYLPQVAEFAAAHSQLESLQSVALLSAPVDLGAARVADGLYVALGELEHAFFVPEKSALVLSDAWLHGGAHDDSLDVYSDTEAAQSSREASVTLMSAQFGDFIEGDLVVHVQHGIARFKGLATVKIMDISGDFLVLEYAGNDKIYVPVTKMSLVQKYLGAAKGDDSVLDSLKGGNWEKRKAKAKEEAEKLARELMEHQAKRAMTPGHAFAKMSEDYFDFESAFPYDETPDQIRALKEIMSDMSKPKAMDRLLVGDVGFGKTEVAMRAAYRSVLDGKQVAWLVPTTVLAHQHTRSLQERFAQFGVEIVLLDRSVSTVAAKKTLERIANGEIDIIIGTHRLLSRDIKYRDLGLLVVDEEQRFGVMQKEKIKSMSYGVDVLTMTATPIPRTLQMAMLGIRDLSLLTTAPKARLAVKTFVCPFDETIVRDSIFAELGRGGQVFYVHNRVEELETIQHFLAGLVPGARICVGHGKMSEKELDKTMIAFLDHKFDILLCTTIIESGIDMPNVNTILVQNADQFGLSQLYQIRGRVGRRSTRGYAYFLTSPNAVANDEGLRRLEILREHQELGSGFVIASHDLEMRGAGNVLGEEQSGRVSEVGLETYTQMLDDAIKGLGGAKVKAVAEVEINIPLPLQIPEDYIENSRERLKMYRRFFGARTEESLESLIGECEDRFGPMPQELRNLAEVARIRRWLLAVGALSLTVSDDATEIRLSPDLLQAQGDESAEALVRRVLDLCNRSGRNVRLTPDGRLILGVRKKMFASSAESALSEVKKVLSLLAGQ